MVVQEKNLPKAIYSCQITNNATKKGSALPQIGFFSDLWAEAFFMYANGI
jgi:hypothetical protein